MALFKYPSPRIKPIMQKEKRETPMSKKRGFKLPKMSATTYAILAAAPFLSLTAGYALGAYLPVLQNVA